jgi:AraC family transcriptional regulator
MKVEAVLTNSPNANVPSVNSYSRQVYLPSQAGTLLDRREVFRSRRSADGESAGLHDGPGASDRVQIAPRDIVKRRAVACQGMVAEIVQATKHEKIEYRYRGPFHLLVAYEQGVRRDGLTSVEGLSTSNLRDFRKKLTFVPAGHDYRECHTLQALSRVAFFHLDPAKMQALCDIGPANLAPRLHFENTALWDTALKLTALIESSADGNGSYVEALGTVLAHELARLGQATPHVQTLIRGGLAAWQQRVVISYIEEHLAEQISLATLAQAVRLSTFHFCRAFKQSFGVPPHRYHTVQRIERAKMLLAKPSPSVTDIGLTVGFSQTSSFTAAFRRATGLTPTAYHRSLA